MPAKKNQAYFRGCLVGGAVGDALGHPVEFLSYSDIQSRFGEAGISDLVLAASGTAEITDDTQMTLFTSEGIIRARAGEYGKKYFWPTEAVYHAYQRWLVTQGHRRFDQFEEIYNGWLLAVSELHAVRAPGRTCISALASGKMGDLKNPINNSKGCGGVMRVAPAGLAYTRESAFQVGAEFAAITHGHPSGYLAAGALALVIAAIIEGSTIDAAAEEAVLALKDFTGHEECTESMQWALELAGTDRSDHEAIKSLGEGWVAEEALAIALYCALKYSCSFREAIIAAVNHDGDSDSTGSITGNIVGAYLGLGSIPRDWIEKLELREVILKLADDLLVSSRENDQW